MKYLSVTLTEKTCSYLPPDLVQRLVDRTCIKKYIESTWFSVIFVNKNGIGKKLKRKLIRAGLSECGALVQGQNGESLPSLPLLVPFHLPTIPIHYPSFLSPSLLPPPSLISFPSHFSYSFPPPFWGPQPLSPATESGQRCRAPPPNVCGLF